MVTEKSPLVFSFTRKIADIPVEDWSRLCGEEVVEGYGYLKTLEESGLQEFSFGYLLARRREKLSLAIPFFISSFDIPGLLPPVLQKPFAPLRKRFPGFLKARMLFVGSPTTEEFCLGIDKEVPLREIMDGALEELLKFGRKERIAVTSFFNLSEKHAELRGYLRRKGWIEMQDLPTTGMEISAGSLAEYIESLGKNTRKSLRKKLRESQAQIELKTEEYCEADGMLNEIYRLYLNNLSEADVSFERLTPEFFRNIFRNLPGVAKLFITRAEGKIAAFNLCLVKGSTCIDKFIGFDREMAHKYHLYYTTFTHNIDWCIKNKIRFYQPGQTDYEPKVRLGAKLIPLYISARAPHPLVHAGLKLCSKFLSPKNLDPKLKAIEKRLRRKDQV